MSTNGSSDWRDESDRDGMRIVIELKRDTNPNVLLNRLYNHTLPHFGSKISLFFATDSCIKLVYIMYYFNGHLLSPLVQVI
jgi:DNA gyrase/topoisomerase IV subunit A